MNARQIEAYKFYKEMYPGAVVLFHVGVNYVALSEDALLVAQSLGVNGNAGDEFRFPDNDVSIISKLGDNCQLHMVEYRNDDGFLDFPDVERLKREKDEDY